MRSEKKIKIKELLLLKGSFEEILVRELVCGEKWRSVREFMLTMMPSSPPNSCKSNSGPNLHRLLMMMVPLLKILTILYI